MDLEQALAMLAEVRDAVTAEFADVNPARLAQFTTHLDTAAMAVEHLHDERARAAHDRAERIRRAEAGE